MVRALLTGFVTDEIVRHFDLQTLEKQNGSYIADDLRDREDDIIWRVKFKEQWLYRYVSVLVSGEPTATTWRQALLSAANQSDCMSKNLRKLESALASG